MDKQELSILHQKARKTYQRNQQIKTLYKELKNMAEVGRCFRLTRQAVRKILSES